jgi:predicted lipid-binding transport protein (Tim44 family)
MTRLSLVHRLGLALAFAGSISLALYSVAEARPGGGGGAGSRGARTQSAPAATPTAPKAAPIERSATPSTPSAAQSPGALAAAPAAASRPWFGGGLMAGLLGAGLFGAVLGAGFSGGLGGIMSFIGLLLQAALLAGIVMLAIRFFRSRSAAKPAVAMAGAGMARDMPGGVPREMPGMPTGMMPAGNTARAAAPVRPVPLERHDDIGIGPNDYGHFERLLGEIQLAYGREDIATLRALTTQEMASYFAEEIAANVKRGVLNRISNVRLLAGDLSEAWREREGEYATLAMRFALLDETLDRVTLKPAPGVAPAPAEATELWTFRRNSGASWALSAIQQAA